MLRSVLAVLAGLAIMFVAVMVGNLVAAAALLGDGAMTGGATAAPLPGAYLVANLGISLAAALLGGYTTARMIGRRSLPQVLVLAGLIALLGLVSAFGPASAGQPRWYAWVLPVIGVVGVLAGGHIGSRAGTNA